ncbi:protein ALP1-like [Brachypodium distachyon]|uniref:protein ALP1-like n=1 Tax=Brachypodium distachyon TaxID=15368 RepID=UPI000D0DBE13|nr:protein ALP1-like [Brachypodium distachyon]|eukprot:XP_024313841.1 protein ALP1-like [Brachypodium distachyon]
MHVSVTVPAKDTVNHVGRAGYATQNVMGVCDFDMRFISVVAGWPGSAHDTRIFKDTLDKYKEKFPHPPRGKFYFVDSGYPNQTGYLAPFRGTRYHLPEYQHGVAASGRKEVFNYLHSSLRNVIERYFAILKQRWRMLKAVPSYPPRKQARIIIACMALHNFIRDSNLYDYHFARCDDDEDYMPPGHVVNTSGGSYVGSSNATMDATRDRIADALMAARE